MSNQFSYELDERQIRIMLRDGEAENDPAAWNRFEQLAQPDAKPRKASFSPGFNISISRSVLVPLIFVVLIGGLSATLFSFVDFKKKDVKVTKNTLEQKGPNTPLTKTSTSPQVVTATDAQPATTVSATPEKTVSIPVEKIIATPTPTVQQPAITHTETKPAIQKTETKVITHTAIAAPATVTAANTKADQPVVKRRKQKKVVSEEIPTINTSSTNLNQASQEPELELR